MPVKKSRRVVGWACELLEHFASKLERLSKQRKEAAVKPRASGFVAEHVDTALHTLRRLLKEKTRMTTKCKVKYTCEFDIPK